MRAPDSAECRGCWERVLQRHGIRTRSEQMCYSMYVAVSACRLSCTGFAECGRLSGVVCPCHGRAASERPSSSDRTLQGSSASESQVGGRLVVLRQPAV